MENSVNSAGSMPTPAASTNELSQGFPFAPEPAPAAQNVQQKPQSGEQKGAGAVDAPRLAEARGTEPRKNVKPQNQRPTDQQKVGKAFQLESQRIERQKQAEFEQKLAADPFRKIGFRMAQDLMRSKGYTQEQAIAEMDNSFYDAVAERDKISPALARHLYREEAPSAQLQQNVPGKANAEPEGAAEGEEDEDQDSDELDEEAQARAIVTELHNMTFPDGFDMDAAKGDPEFANILADFGPRAGVEIYHARQLAAAAAEQAEKAPQVVADQLKARSAIPQSSKTAAVAGPQDFRNMTPQEFRKYQRDNHLI